MWYHTDGLEKHYCCENSIYLLTCIALESYIIIDRSVGEPENIKDVVYGLNDRDKRMLKLEMTKLLNT